MKQATLFLLLLVSSAVFTGCTSQNPGDSRKEPGKITLNGKSTIADTVTYFTADSLTREQWTNPKASERETQLLAEEISNHNFEIRERLLRKAKSVDKKFQQLESEISKIDKQISLIKKLSDEKDSEIALIKQKKPGNSQLLITRAKHQQADSTKRQ